MTLRYAPTYLPTMVNHLVATGVELIKLITWFVFDACASKALVAQQFYATLFVYPAEVPCKAPLRSYGN